jgi:nicotinate-nucleotide adenylyltransferase
LLINEEFVVREIGVFCGTFNPIHWGHLMLAEFARDQFDLEKVIVVTSPNPPHRHQDLLDAELRHELVVAACQGNQFFHPSRLELDRSGPSYTVDTLRAIRLLEDGAQGEIAPAEVNDDDNALRLNFLVGQDNLLSLKEWHEAAALFSLCRILVATRTSTVTREEVQKELPANASFELIDFPQVPVSSSLIRTRIRAEKTVMYLVPPAVNDIVESKGLYKLQAAKAPGTGRMKHARHTRQN